MRIVEHSAEVLFQQPPGLAAEEQRHRVARLGDVSFQGMGHGVDAGQRGHARRLGDGQRRVQQRNAAGGFLIAAGHLDVGLGVGDQANDWASLPVPAVVGTAIIGSISRSGLADAPIVLHPPAVGVEEVDPLGAVHRAAAAQADEHFGLDRRFATASPASTLSVVGFSVTPSNRCVSMPARCSAAMPRSACPAAMMPGSLTTNARRAPNSPAKSPNESTLLGPKTIRVRS